MTFLTYAKKNLAETAFDIPLITHRTRIFKLVLNQPNTEGGREPHPAANILIF